ncbi:MAG: hypothetical protein ACREEB_08805 [Caulobacteraceae bacterium]
MASTSQADAVPLSADGASVPSASLLDAERQGLRDAFARLTENDNTRAIAAFRVVVESPSFAELTSQEQHAALLSYGVLSLGAGDFAKAHALLKQATSLDEAIGVDWFERLDAAGRIGDDADSLFVLSTIAVRWPASLDQINDRFIVSLFYRTHAKKDLAEARYTALSALSDAGWTSHDQTALADDMWLDLIQMLLERDKVDAAGAVAGRLVTPVAIVKMRVDKMFDPIVRDRANSFAVTSVMATRLASLRAAAKAAPNDVEAAAALGLELISQNRPGEALAFLDDVAAKAAPDSGEPLSNTDSLIWVLNERADALTLLGRDDEALTTLAKAASRPEHGEPNTSQILNLGEKYADLGRPREALDSIKDVGSMSGYGRMTLEHIRACSFAQLGDAADLKASLKYLREHDGDAPKLLFEALLCANDQDAASGYLIKELANPQTRQQFLVRMQDFASVREAPFAAEVSRRRLAVRARPEVRAAILAVGHIDAYPIIAP